MLWVIVALGMLLMAIAAPYILALPLFSAIGRLTKSPD